jgi:signal transduction histidine kinase
VVNLLHNAIIHAADSEWIDVRLGCMSGADDGRASSGDGAPGPALAQIEVQAYGRGLPPEEIDSLFTRFYQATYGRPRGNGLGLGLFICKQLVEQHGGTIGVESAVGEGSTFTIRLPLAAP